MKTKRVLIFIGLKLSEIIGAGIVLYILYIFGLFFANTIILPFFGMENLSNTTPKLVISILGIALTIAIIATLIVVWNALVVWYKANLEQTDRIYRKYFDKKE